MTKSLSRNSSFHSSGTARGYVCPPFPGNNTESGGRAACPAKPWRRRASRAAILERFSASRISAFSCREYESAGIVQFVGGRNGVALVLVLGMLALMTILAVSFTISMRVERLAAGAHADIVRSHQLMNVARKQVVEDIDRSLGLCTKEAFTADGGGRLQVSDQYTYRANQRVYIEDTGNLPANLSTGVVYYIKADSGAELRLTDSPGGGDINVNPGSGVIRVQITERQCSTMVDADNDYINVPDIDAFALGDVVFVKSTSPLVNLQEDQAYTIQNYEPGNDRFMLQEVGAGGFINLQCSDCTLFVTRYDGWETFASYDVDLPDSSTIRRLSVRKPILTGTEIMFRNGNLPVGEYETCYAIRVNDTNIDIAVSYTDAVQGRRISLPSGSDYNGELVIKGSVYPPWRAATSFSDNNPSHAGGVLAVDLFTNDPSGHANTIFPVSQTYRFEEDDCVYVDSTGTLPGGLGAGNDYYVVPVYSNGGLQLLDNIGDATEVSISSQGSGIHSIRFVDREAARNIPDALWEDACDLEALALTNYWISLYAPITENNSLLMGMVGYNILNCSGLIDINAAGLESTRGMGTNPLELAVGCLPEVSNPANVLTKRNTYHRFETIHELAELGSLSDIPGYLFTYSRNLPGFWSSESGFTTNVIALNLDDPADVSPIVNRRSEITNAFHLCGFTNAGSADICYNNLIDYLDDDSVPVNLTNSVELVPMISSVVCSNFVSVVDGTNYFVTNTVMIGVSYPFVADPDPGLQFALTGSIWCATLGFSAKNSCGIYPPFTMTPNGMAIFSFTNSMAYITNSGINPIVSTTTIDHLSIVIDSTPWVVDGITVPMRLTNSVMLPNPRSTVAMLTIDPRLNARPDCSAEWVYTNVTPIAVTNPAMCEYWDRNPEAESNGVMYVRNAPMDSVGEMGFLLCSTNPWRTIRIYGTNADFGVLGRFCVTTNLPTKGLMNPNTSFTNVMSTVFYEMPIDRYPGDVASDTLNENEAISVASEVMSGQPYMNPGEAFAFLNDFPVGGLSEFEKESFVRNSIGLLSTRQNSFLVFLRADSANSGHMARSPVRETGMAVIWRDPFTGESFIRQYKPIGQ